MRQFGSVVKEVNRSLNELILFENIVNTTLIFLLFYLGLSVFDLNPLFAFVPAFLYLVVFSYIRIKMPKAFMVESKHEPLREKLRTAADNFHLDNPIIEELEYEVTREMKNVGLSMFINPRTLSYKIFAVMLLSFLIIFTSTLDLKLLEFARSRVPDIFDNKVPKGVGNFGAVYLNTSEDIYGEKDVARLGDNDLNIRIKPVDFKINVKEEGESTRQNFESTFPKELAVKEAATYEENIPQEQQELVRNYFNKLAEG